MARKKKRRRRTRLPKTTVEPETYSEQRKKFPESLVEAFIAVSNSDWEDDKLYAKFVKEEKRYLGKLYEDRIEQGKLIVNLSRATMDIRENTKKKVKKKRARRKKKC